MYKSSNTRGLESLAASQWGMFTTAQAQRLGVRRNQVSRMVGAMRAEPMCYGVYRLMAGAEPVQADVKAAWLAAFPKETAAERLSRRPPDAVLAGRTAAFALEAGDFLASPYTFIVDRRRQTSRDDVRFLQCKLAEEDVRFANGIPTTSFERTVYDLLRLDEDPDLVDGFMRDAVCKQGHSFDGNRMGILLAPIARRYGFGSGDRFASDLIARNASGIQIARAAESIESALAPFDNRMKDIAKSARTAGDYAEMVASIQEPLANSPAFEKLQENLKTASSQSLSAYPDVAKTLEDIARINIPRLDGLDTLARTLAAAIAAAAKPDGKASSERGRNG